MERINNLDWHYHYCRRHDIESGPCTCWHPKVEDWICLECQEGEEMEIGALEEIMGEENED